MMWLTVPSGYPNPTRYPVFLSIPDPTRFSFRNHRVAGNPKHRVLPYISGKPEVSGTTRAHWKSNRTLNKTPTPTVSSIKLSLPSTVSSTLNTHDLKVVPHVWNTKKSYVNHPHHSISHPSWRTFQLKWYIIMSATSLVIFSLLSLQSTVPSTTKPPEHRLGNWGIRKMDFQRTFKCFSLVLSGLVGVEKNQICENRRWLPSAISELAVRLSLRDP